MTRSKLPFRWIIVFLLFFICVVNYIDRASLAYALDILSKNFHLDAFKLGLLTSFFSVGYIVTTFMGGILVDRLGVRIILLCSAVLWGVSLFVMSIAQSFETLLLSRFMLGLAEGPYFPAMTRAIGDWLPKEERARALSGTLVAVPIALAIGAPIVSQLIIHFGWRGMSAILGCVAWLWIPFWAWLFTNKPEQSNYIDQRELYDIKASSYVPEASHSTEKGAWKFLLFNKTLMTNNWSFFILGAYIFFFMNWLPSYLHQHFYLNLKAEGLFDIFPWALSAVALIFVSSLSDKLLKNGNELRKSRSYIILISQLMAAVLVFPVLVAKNVDQAIFFISLALACGMSSNAVIYAVNIDVAKKYLGRSLGVMDTFFALSGILIPIATGFIVQVTGSFYGAFALLSILALSSVIFIAIFHRPDKEEKALF